MERECGIKRLYGEGNKQPEQKRGIKRYVALKGKIELLPPLSLTLKLRATLESGGMLKYTVLSFPPSSLSIARNTCTT